MPSLRPPDVVVARHAMATRFEIALHGSNPAALRAAAEEALDEIDRVESQLSIYRPSSDLARVNREAAHRPVPVDPRVLRFLLRARELSAATGGAFDMTAAPLIRVWGFMGGSGTIPEPGMVAAAKAAVGWHHVVLDQASSTVRFVQPSVLLDPGAIGKGYALDRAVEILRDGGVESALVHGGTSTVCAIGSPPDADAWRVALPTAPASAPPSAQPPALSLRDTSLSISAVWGKSFESGGTTLGHVIDPRSGEPITGARFAAVIHPEAIVSDAISTALLVLGNESIPQLQTAFPGAQFPAAESIDA